MQVARAWEEEQLRVEKRAATQRQDADGSQIAKQRRKHRNGQHRDRA